MDGYQCAYRDPKSPLTPIIPLKFNFNNDNVTPSKFTKSPNKFLTPNCSDYKSDKVDNRLSPSAYKILFKFNISPGLQHVKTTTEKKSSIQLEKFTEKLKHYNNTPSIPREKFLKKSPKSKNIDSNKDDLKENQNIIKSANKKKQVQLDVKPRMTNYCFKRTASPILKKKLCPIISNILEARSLGKYLSLFEAEEIDNLVFPTMTENDLIEIGVRNKDDIKRFLNIIEYSLKAKDIEDILLKNFD